MEKRRRKENKSLRLGELGEGHWMRTAVDSNARRPDLPVGGKFNAQWKICVAFSNPIQSNRVIYRRVTDSPMLASGDPFAADRMRSMVRVPTWN